MRIVKRTLKAKDLQITEARQLRPAKASEPASRPPAAGPAARRAAQRTLSDEDDVVVVVPPNKAVAARTQAAPAPAGSFRPLGDPDSITAGARLAIAHALYRDLGAEGTVLESPKGTSFALRSGVGRGEVRTPHAVLVPLPEGHVTPHQADLVVELENGALLVLDVVTTGIRPEDLKGLAYDALQFRRLDRCFAVLVVVRVPRSALSQDQVQALGHGYDHFFGVTEDDARSEMKYAALRSRVAAWISAAGGR